MSFIIKGCPDVSLLYREKLPLYGGSGTLLKIEIFFKGDEGLRDSLVRS